MRRQLSGVVGGLSRHGVWAIAEPLWTREMSRPGVWLAQQVIDAEPFFQRLAAKGLVPTVVEQTSLGATERWCIGTDATPLSALGVTHQVHPADGHAASARPFAASPQGGWTGAPGERLAARRRRYAGHGRCVTACQPLEVL